MEKANYNHCANGFRFFKILKILPVAFKFGWQIHIAGGRGEKPRCCGSFVFFHNKICGTAVLTSPALASLRPLPPSSPYPTPHPPARRGAGVWFRPAPLFSAERRFRSVLSVGGSCRAGAGRAGRGWARLGEGARCPHPPHSRPPRCSFGRWRRDCCPTLGADGTPRRLGQPPLKAFLPSLWTAPCFRSRAGENPSERLGFHWRIPA